ncbi:hypothetical protein Prudu_489S000400 [Prunus dulcis]|uniref:Integrase catalytic domain-containing protein n=1 Tax=Prunus dulcis TaxID=3755 RepID=A0A5H2XXR9_PRUDU|nr:hypothetical protein Prudu_489S000400 [Prunus dulcis]
MASPLESSSPIPSIPTQNPNSSSSNPNSFQTYTSLTIQNIGSMVPIKLKRSNYLPWCALFAPILRRYKLLGLIDGTEPCPMPFLPDRSLNPAYESWYEKDQNLLIWFNSTLSEEVIPFTVGVSSSRDLWLKLEQRFGGVSDAHIHQLRSRLQSIQKGSQTMADYLQQIKEISDSLTAAGASVSDRDLIAATLAGLPDEFESFIDSIMLRLSSTSLDELHGLLLTKELSMTRRKKIASSATTEPFHALSAQVSPPLLPTPPQAFAAQHPPLQNSFRYNSNRGRNNQFSNNRGNYGNNRGNYNSGSHRGNHNSGFPSGFNRGHNSNSRGSFSSGARVPCQICGNPSHEAIDCYDRMNPAISGKIPPTKLAAMCAHYTSKPSPSWLIDSGATSHITNDISNLSSPSPYTGEDKVYIGDGTGLSINHIGSSLLHTPTTSFKLKNVLHVPQMKHNLLSAFQFVKDNSCSLTLDSDGSLVKDRFTGKMLLRGPVRDGSYPLQSSPSPGTTSSISSSAFVSIKAPVQIWHSRLGHPSSNIFRKVISGNKLALQGKSSVDFFCSDCAIAKNHKLPFHPAGSSTSHSLALLHCDVWGPAPVTSVSGFQYYLLLVDDYTRYSWFFPLRRKSEVYSTFVTFKTYVEKSVGNQIKAIRSDSGGEFTSASFQSYLNLHGISHQFSCPHTPEQNGCVERKHRHLVETARTLLVASNVPKVYWVEALSTATYLINRLPISGLAQSPWELLFHTLPDYTRLKIFGCSCYPWLKPYVSSKLDGKSRPCVFLGYSLQHKGYRCLDMLTDRVYISRHVLFDEKSFPFTAKSASPSDSIPTLSPVIDLQFPIPNSHSVLPSSPSIHPSSHTPNTSEFVSPHNFSPLQSHSSSHSLPGQNIHPMVTRSKNGIFKPKAYTATKHPLSSSLDYVPTTYHQASKFAAWRSAMQAEFNALQSTGTWILVPSSSSQNVVGCKWVFRIKKKPDGTIDRYKARLVAKGFHQKEGLDYQETFSPVAKPVTIRLLLTFAVQFNWFLHQLDISNAFLHGDLKEEVFMHQPPGFSDPNFPNHVCQLKKSLYGLKQAPRAWFDKLFQALKSLGFTQSSSDASLFVLKVPVLVIVLVYVDDILVSGPDSSVCNLFIKKLSSLFPVKDLGPLHYFLGLEVQRTDEGLFLHQGKYLMDLLQKTKMEGAKPCSTPLGTTKLDHGGIPLDNPTEYRSIVGGLQYLTWTRPDISFAVNQVCQFMHAPTDSICRQPSEYSDFSKVHLHMVYGFIKVLSLYPPTLMQTGLAALLIGDPRVDFVCFLAPT